MYSTELRTITGQMYTDCTPYSGTLSCINGNIQGNYGIYRYDIYECNSGTPRNCDTQRAG
ncbi:hypothetical protein KKG31_03910 [Patescibacteria group bacterium]|nr:hypothetical protein [Patescibacteria group bacterium]MBU1758287.1 hypothetical protein [Patescibacteria group bacterium]